MFKKPFKTQQQNLLKSSDKRKLRDNLLRNFPNIKEDELNQVYMGKMNEKGEKGKRKRKGHHVYNLIILGVAKQRRYNDAED
jgi:hypothetical protein